jgi:excinuclease ABC subunit C
MITVPAPPPPDQLRADVRARAENRPGVYRMLGPRGEVLYVGKSVRVRTRLLSYFRSPRGDKAAEIVSHTHHVDWEYVPSEFAALLLEMRLILAHRPVYNVQHKRNRAFCFLKLTREAASRVRVAFEVRDDGSWYAGPFRGVGRMREVAREVADLLELRDCAARTPMRFADQLDLFGREETPLCLRADLGRCLAPCAGRCTRTEYRARTEVARRFLLGDAEAPLNRLRQRLEAAAERLQFEYAATLRDRLVRLELARDELAERRGAIDALTFVYQPEALHGDAQVYVVRRGLVSAELTAPCNAHERAQVAARASALFHRAPRDDLRPAQAAEILLLARWFRLHPEEEERVWNSPRGGTARLGRLPLLA